MRRSFAQRHEDKILVAFASFLGIVMITVLVSALATFFGTLKWVLTILGILEP